MILHGLLKKIFRLRETAAGRRPKGADDGFDAEEKPFLDHLEDLRVMFFKIILTLLVAIVGCFFFKQQLMEGVKLPMIWANVGNPDAINAIFSIGKDPLLSRFEVGDLVVTQGGLIGKVTALDGAAGISTLEVADGVQVKVKTDTLMGAIDTEAGTLDEGSVMRMRNQRLLIMETFQPQEGLVIVLKLTFYAAIIVSFPFLLWWIMEFVLPGLRQAEKAAVLPAIFVGFLLFLVGSYFAFRVGLPFALRFLAQWNYEHGMEPGWRIGYYMRFITQVTLVFGLAFQLPVVVLALVKMELLTFRTMRDSRAYAIVILLVISAFLTPPDPMTLALLGGPLVILYEICIWLAWFMERKQRRLEKEEEKRRAEEQARLAERRAEMAAARSEGGETPPGEMDPDDVATADGTATDPVHPDDHHEVHEHDPYHQDPHQDPYHDWDHDHHGHDYHASHPVMIDINHATVEELQQLPGIGPKLAQRLLEARPFYSEEELEYHAHLPQSVIKLILDRIYFH